MDYLPLGGMIMTLDDEARIARAMGLSYGRYKAMQYNKPTAAPRKITRPRAQKRRYTDEDAFRLWQEGKNDCEIGAILGVSRQIIQRWRDTMELPSTNKQPVDTKNYHLVRTSETEMFVIYGDGA